MLNTGEYAVYGMNGVCRVTGTENRGGDLYYVFEPLQDKTLKIFVPAKNTSVRPPIDEDQARSLLESISRMNDIWINNSRDRRRIFGDILNSHDLPEIIGLAKTLWCKKRERRKNGKAMYSYEDNQLRTAERAIAGELAFALKIEVSDAVELLETGFSAC